MGVPDSRGAVPTKDECRTDRLSMMNWLTKAPPETRHRLRPMPGQTHPAKSCQVVSACFLDREYQSGIHPKEQSPKQSTRYQKLSFELRNSSDDKFWLSPCP
jgi:hypothetical protein